MSQIIEQFHQVLKKTIKLGASDIHLNVGSLWKFRLDGRIVAINSLPKLSTPDCNAIVHHLLKESKSIPEDEIENRAKTIDEADLSYAVPGASRFRVNICRQRGTYAIVFRAIPFTTPTIDKLKLPPVIKDIALEDRGLVLVTGITGCGKSTTLAAMITEINSRKSCKIVTIEDPIEFLYSENKASIIQREVGSDTSSFAVALRAALRQDPDVILVGEMRDRETIDIALKAAETGHLVLSTLHTPDAPKTIQRIISVFELSEQKIMRQRISESLKAVISQRLLTRADNKGRIAALEIMRHTLTIQECIENPEKTASMKDHMAEGRNQYGMQTFDQHLMELFNEQIIDLDTAKGAATSASDFQRAVNFA